MADGELDPLRMEKETFRGTEMLNVLNLSRSVEGMLRHLNFINHVFEGIATHDHEFR